MFDEGAIMGLKDDLGTNWFAGRVGELKRNRPEVWHPNHTYDRNDPGVILRDFVHEADSPYRSVFGYADLKLIAARKILSTRNIWFHFGDDPTLDQLLHAMKTVRWFVTSSSMHIGKKLETLVGRLEEIKARTYTGRPEATESEAPMSEPGSGLQTIDAPTDLPRPPIGGTWIGAIPTLRYRMTRTGDVLHPDTMNSVSAQVVGDFKDKVRAWTAVEPRGRELWIDADGAVGGYIGATPRLLGYLATEPEDEVARGFFVPHYYVVVGGEVLDLDTGERLVSEVADTVADGTMLRVTTYGDVLKIDDDSGIERVATVRPAGWFPGHLG